MLGGMGCTRSVIPRLWFIHALNTFRGETFSNAFVSV
jgi:hypothetical protein